MKSKINWHGDLFTNGEKPTRQKPHRVILRSPLPRIHYYQNKQLQVKESQYLIQTYNWTITPIPNWTCSVVTMSHFQCTTLSTWLTNYVDPSMRLNHQLEKDVGCKIFSSSHNEDHEVVWSQNLTVYKTQQLFQEKEELGQTRFLITLFFALVELCSCATFITFYGP